MNVGSQNRSPMQTEGCGEATQFESRNAATTSESVCRERHVHELARATRKPSNANSPRVHLRNSARTSCPRFRARKGCRTNAAEPERAIAMNSGTGMAHAPSTETHQRRRECACSNARFRDFRSVLDRQTLQTVN